MAAERTLPIPASHREFTVKVGGEAVGREHQALGIYVSKAANRIASARLIYLDGTAASSDFPLSNAATFVPGAEVQILAGDAAQPAEVFRGIVVSQAVKVRERAAPQLVVECRHEAARLTAGRGNAVFVDQTDGEVISSILEGAGIKADVEITTARHPRLVQYRCTDWDFLLARAEASGKLVFTNGEVVEVRSPDPSATSVCRLQFGSTVLEMDVEIDARLQRTAVKSVTWDPARQEVVVKEAADPGIAGAGNLACGDLAGAISTDGQSLIHASLADDEAQAWADAEWARSRIAKVRGRVKCEGIATIAPGDVVTIDGAGDRFAGDVLVTAIRHDFDLVQGWKTHVEFGGVERRSCEERDVSAPRAAALLPAVSGLQIGVVLGNEDPDGEHRIAVRLPLVADGQDGVMARVAVLDAGSERGFFFRPEIGDEVVVGFLDDDPRQAVVLGMLHSSALPAPLEGTDENHEKVYQSRSKMRLYFNDEKKIARIDTPAGNSVLLSEDEKVVRIEDQNGNTVEMSASGVQIESRKAIGLKAGTELTLEAGTALKVKGGTELKLEGASGAELSSAVMTTIKGGMVQIN
jgi:Rhs element Vgr protein